MLLDEIARTSAAVAQTPARLKKIDLLAETLRHARPDEIPTAVAYLSGVLPQGTIGVGWASLRGLPAPALPPPTLKLLDVDAAFEAINTAAGPGSQTARRNILAGTFGKATATEQQFLTKLLLGELRQGAQEKIMLEAVAKAAGVPTKAVRRALMLAGDLGAVAKAVIAEGQNGLARFRFRLQILRPIQPMLAQTASDLHDALNRISPAAVEWKLDGARIQVHRLGDEVRAFTRSLADITERVPEVVEAARALPVNAVILDGEAIALTEDGRPQLFQVTMSRFGSRLDIEQHRNRTPLSPFFFDCLHLDGDDLIDRPTKERLAALDTKLPEAQRVPRALAPDPTQARHLLDTALQHGHEGVMVKALDAPYEAGRRGAGWL